MFDFNLSENPKTKVKKLSKKDKRRSQILNKKIKQIISSDKNSINHYKNLKGKLKEFKRVHIDNSFVLIFKVDIEKNYIRFLEFDHHDKIYQN